MLDVTDSYTRAVAVTPTDTVPTALFAQPGPAYARRLWVGENGTVTLLTLGGDTVQYVVQVDGVYLLVNFTQVMNTGTSAHEMVAEY